MPAKPPQYVFGEFCLDMAARQLRRGEAAVHVSPKALDLLALLLEHGDRAVSKEEIMEALWPGVFVSEANLPSLVNELRRALDDPPRQPRFVRTVHRFGYAFCGAVSTGAGEADPLVSASCWLVWRGRELRLRRGENVIGREEGVDVRIDAPSVSRRHARIHVTPQAVTVEDLGSKNGTRIDDQPVRTLASLSDLDTLTIGSVEVTVRVGRGTELTKTIER